MHYTEISVYTMRLCPYHEVKVLNLSFLSPLLTLLHLCVVHVLKYSQIDSVAQMYYLSDIKVKNHYSTNCIRFFPHQKLYFPKMNREMITNYSRT